MLEGLLKKIFGDPNAKELKDIQGIVDKINALEPEMQALSSANLAAKTGEFKLRLAKGETLDDILPEAFAVVRETSKRVTGMRHFELAAWCCTAAKLPRCVPAKAKRWLQPCLRT